MNKFDLNAYGVVEMDAQQEQEVNGGIIGAIALWLIGCIAYDIISNGPDSAASAQSGYNYVMSM